MRRLLKSVIFLAIIATLIYGGITGYNKLLTYLYPIKYSEYVEKYSKEFDVPETLIYAVIHSESTFDPLAQSQVGAKGLMQMLPDAFEWAKSRYNGESDETDIFDAETNIKYGTLILHLHYDTFGGWVEVLSAYHAGAGNVKSWLQNPDYSLDGKTINSFPSVCADTEHYVNKVLKTQQKYTELYYVTDTERTIVNE